MDETNVQVVTCDRCNQAPADCDCAICGECSEPVENVCDRCDGCSDCCACCHCEGCSEPVENVCDRCDCCNDCCECAWCDYNAGHACESTCERCSCCERHCHCCHCSNCGHACEYTCDSCDECDECCSCSSSDGRAVGRAVELISPRAAPVFHRASKKEHRRAPSRRYIACELEISDAEHGDAVADAVRDWDGAIVEDGSIRSADGFEICTAPASGDVFCQQVEEICAALAEQRADVTHRCGYHVHIDARDYTWWDIRKLVKLYAKLEDALFKCVPPSRRSNEFCEPCAGKYLAAINGTTSTKMLKKDMLRSLYGPKPSWQSEAEAGKELAQKRRLKYQPCRYAALNLHSWLYRGTIECRLAPGTTSAEKVIAWGILWAGILDYASSHTEKQIDSLQGDSWSILLQVAPTDEVRTWLQSRRDKFATS